MMAGGRKFLGSVLVLSCGITIAFVKGDIPPNLLNLLQTVYLAFIVGNGTEHFTDMIRKISDAKLAVKQLETNAKKKVRRNDSF